MTLLISTRLVIILSISPFILLGVFVLSIFHPLNVTNLLLKSTRCAFMGYRNAHKGFVCYDATANKPRASRNVIFFENQYFFQSHLLSQSDMSHVVERFKPGFVYQRHRPRPATPFPATDSPPDLVNIEPRQSSRVT